MTLLTHHCIYAIKEGHDMNIKDFGSKLTFRDWDTYDLVADSYLDKDNLDEEARAQPHLMAKWLTLLTEALAEQAKANERLKDVEGDLFLKGRTEGVRELGSKPTEATVKAWVRQQKKFKRAMRDKIEADKAVTYLNNAKTVLVHKKDMIIKESELWMTGYYSRPNVNNDAVKSQQKANMEKISDQLTDKLQHRGKRKKSNKREKK